MPLDCITAAIIQHIATEEDEIMRLASTMALMDDAGRRAFTATMIHEAGHRIAGHWRDIADHMRGDEPIVG